MNRKIFSAFVLILILIFSLSMSRGSDKKLNNPFAADPSKDVVSTAKKFEKCGNPPRVMTDSMGVTFYTDKKSSIPDEKRKEQNKEAFLPLIELKKGVAGMSEAYFSSRPLDPRPAACVLDWLYSYARGDGLMGRSNPQGNNEISWALASLSLSYLRIKEEPTLDPSKKNRVEKWLAQLAQRIQIREERSKNPKMNNLAYWTGLAVGLAGIAVQNKSFFGFGMKKYHLFLKQVHDDGTLPLELDRGRRALAYHAFSAVPLVLLAEAAYANGENYFQDGSPLEKLVDRIFDGYYSQSYFSNLTKEPQDKLKPTDLAFLEIIVSHYPRESYKKFLMSNRPLVNPTLNENFTLFFGNKL